jgi:hypothetical protein
MHDLPPPPLSRVEATAAAIAASPAGGFSSVNAFPGPPIPKGVPMSSVSSISVELSKAFPTDNYSAKAYAAQSADSGLAAFTIPRRALQPHDVKIDIPSSPVTKSSES